MGGSGLGPVDYSYTYGPRQGGFRFRVDVVKLVTSMRRPGRPSESEPLILLIDDDAKLGALMSKYFSQHEYRLEVVHDGREGLARVFESQHDLVILDVMLPTLNGFEILRQLRRRSKVPVIMLTGRAAQRDRIIGLDAGADDYLLKPFVPRELLARVRAGCDEPASTRSRRPRC